MPFARTTTDPAFRDAWSWLGKEAEPFREEVRDLPPSPRATRTGLQAELQAQFDLEGGGELAHRFPGWRARGVRALPVRPALYLSGEAHHSMAKVVRMTGLGTESLRPVPVGQDFAMDVEALHRMIREDLRDGWSPFMVVATAGTTGTGAVDPLRKVADVVSFHGLWLHVDAAWGGAAVLSPTLKPLLAGIEKADSVTWDAHKWLAVPMGAGMFFCRHRDAAVRAFSVSTGYMPPDATDGIPDAYVSTPQWSRRAIGLKLFMAMAHLGEVGYARLVEAQAAMGERLRELLLGEGWLVLNDTRLPVVCFTHERIRQRGADPDRVLEALYRRGKVWISAVTLPTGERALRACVTSYLTDEEDLRVLLPGRTRRGDP